MSTCTRGETPSFRLRSLALYSRLAHCQRNPLPIQIPPTYIHSHHPKEDHAYQRNRYQTRPMFTCTRADPQSLRLRPLASYPRLALCQRNPLPIRIAPTYNHSRHPKGDHSSQETGTRQDPFSHAPDMIPSSFRLRSLALYPMLAPAKGILSQFKSLPPTTTPATLQGTTPPKKQVLDKTHVHMYPS